MEKDSVIDNQKAKRPTSSSQTVESINCLDMRNGRRYMDHFID